MSPSALGGDRVVRSRSEGVGIGRPEKNAGGVFFEPSETKEIVRQGLDSDLAYRQLERGCEHPR
jgi:hypothetical protein